MNWILIAAAWTLLCVQGATAQTIPPSRGFVVVNGGFQLTANDFSDSATKRENAEDGSLNTAYVVQKGPAFDIAAGGIIKGRLAVGAGVSRFQVATPSSLTASVPHPFFFNRPRTVSGTASGLSREELAVHVHAGGTFPIGTRVQVMVFGGPSLFKVRQGLVTDFSYSDSYPYDDATFASATTGTSNVSKIGFNALRWRKMISKS